MINHRELKQAMARIAVSYILIHIHFKLGNVDLLPEWLGYVIIYKSLPVIGQNEESANLLQPLGIILIVVSLVQWILSILGTSIPFTVVELLSLILALYFHFQLLTDLARIMSQLAYPHFKRILHLRTAWTVLTAFAHLPFSFMEERYCQIVILILFLIVIVWLCAALYNMSRWLEAQQTENPS